MFHAIEGGGKENEKEEAMIGRRGRKKVGNRIQEQQKDARRCTETGPRKEQEGAGEVLSTGSADDLQEAVITLIVLVSQVH